MALGIDNLNLLCLPRELCLNLDYLSSRPGQRVEYHDGNSIALSVDVSQNLTEGLIRDFAIYPSDVLKIALCVQIVHRNTGTWHDVMKLIEQKILPREFQFILRIVSAEQKCHGGVFFRVQRLFFCSADSPFGL